MHHSHFKIGMVLLLRVLHIAYRIQAHQLSTSYFTTWFIFRHSVRNQCFPSHLSQQPCITATSNLVWCFSLGSYRSLTKFRSASYLLSVLQLWFSYMSFVINIFCCTFVSNHASQTLQTWYGVSSWSPTQRILNSGPPVIYFLFYHFVYIPHSVCNQYFHIISISILAIEKKF